MKVTIRMRYQLMFVITGYFLLACASNSQVRETAVVEPTTAPASSQEPKTIVAEPTKTSSSSSDNVANTAADRSIRGVDFDNFTYPWHKDLIDPRKPEKSFTLRNGEQRPTYDKRGFNNGMGVGVATIIYGDATSDGIEEAIIVLSLVTGGSSIPNCIYIYTWRQNKPFLLWSEVTGDRADDGLRDIRIENGKVLIEKYSPHDKKADCCPKYFRRFWLVWQGKRFTQEKQEELLPNVEGIGYPIFLKTPAAK